MVKIEFTVSYKELLRAIMRMQSLETINDNFARTIRESGGFNSITKTGRRCKYDGYEKGIQAMIGRWFLCQEFYGANQQDVVVPDHVVEDKWLRDELFDAGCSIERASELMQALSEIVDSTYQFYSSEVDNVDSNETVSVCFMTILDTYHFLCPKERIPEEYQDIKIKKKYFEYLKRQYETINGAVDLEVENETRTLFLQRVLQLILRYDAISGDMRGYQMALPESVFAFLKEKYHLQHECFASPMNACEGVGSYCSRYKDTDACFGSKGSFFEYSPTEGVYESNPPFVEECMIRNIKHILGRLDEAEKNQAALTFFIVVPKWDDVTCESYNLTVYGKSDRVENDAYSPYYKGKVDIGKGQHFYRNGMDYRDSFSTMCAHSDSLMFILQSSAAAKEMPIEESSFQQELFEKWSCSAPEFMNTNNSRNRESNYQQNRNQRGRKRYRNNDFEKRQRFNN